MENGGFPHSSCGLKDPAVDEREWPSYQRHGSYAKEACVIKTAKRPQKVTEPRFVGDGH